MTWNRPIVLCVFKGGVGNMRDHAHVAVPRRGLLSKVKRLKSQGYRVRDVNYCNFKGKMLLTPASEFFRIIDID